MFVVHNTKTHCLVTYVAYDNSPPCGEDEAIKDTSECGVAGGSLGFSSSAKERYLGTRAPKGCFVFKGITYFNMSSNGVAGNRMCQSVCRKKGNCIFNNIDPRQFAKLSLTVKSSEDI